MNEAVVNAMMKSAYGKTESTHDFKTQRKSEDQGGNAKSASYAALARQCHSEGDADEQNLTAGRTRSAIQHKENIPSERSYRGRAGGASVLRGNECGSETTK